MGAIPAAAVPPGGRQRPAHRETVEYGLGYVLFGAGRLFRDLAVARILGPATFGIWGALLMYRQYSNYSDFGFTNGLGRILPKLLHDGKEPAALRAMGAAWLTAMAGTMAFAAAMAVWLLLSSRSYGSVPLWGIVTVGALMFVDKHYMYSSVVFRSLQRVGESGLWMGLLGVLELLLGAALTRQFGLHGLLLSVAVAALATTAGMSARQRLRGTFWPDAASFRLLVVPSLTLMGLGLANIAIHNVDRVVILGSRGSGAELGQYQLAASLSLVVSQLPCVLLTVLAPKLFRFGHESSTRLRRYFLLPTAIVAVLAGAVGSVTWIALPDLLSWTLPKYAPAVPVARLLMIGEACFAIAMVPEVVMMASDRGLQSLGLRCSMIAGGAAVSVWALGRGHGLAAVAGGMCAVQTAGALAAGWMAARALNVPPLGYVLAAGAPVLYAAAVLAGTTALVPGGGPAWRTLLARLALCGIALLPLTALPLWFLGIRLPGVHRLVDCLQRAGVS